MSDWFKDNLLGLLPPLCEHNDEAGDLRTFLSLPAGTLDELKQAIDDFPTIFDVDHCDERFLPLLARLAIRSRKLRAPRSATRPRAGARRKRCATPPIRNISTG